MIMMVVVVVVMKMKMKIVIIKYFRTALEFRLPPRCKFSWFLWCVLKR